MTLDQLKRRGWNLPHGCYMSKDDEESTDLLLLYCTEVRML